MINQRELDQVSRAIYMAHWGLETLPNNRQSPVWESASENVREFIRKQALAAIEEYERIRG